MTKPNAKCLQPRTYIDTANARHTKHRLDGLLGIGERLIANGKNGTLSVTLDDNQRPVESTDSGTKEPARGSIDEICGTRAGLAPHHSLRAVVQQYLSVGSSPEMRRRRILQGGSLDFLFNLSEARKIADARRPDPLLARSVRVIRAHGGRMPMHALARELCVSERHLERTFRTGTGLSPKQFSRIARLQTLLARIRRAPRQRVSWAELACELGFADQAHLVREFRALTGATPTAYARENGLSYVLNDGLAEV